MRRLIEPKYKNYSMMVLETLMIFDVWLLIKTRWLMIKFIEFIAPVLKVLFFMTLGAGLLLAYVFAYGKVNVNHHHVQKQGSYLKNYEPAINNYLEIDDHSLRPDTVNLRKELVRIKRESMALEKTLYRMNVRLNNLHNRQKNTDANLADFASESVGGLVIATPDTRSYSKPTSKEMTIFGIPIWKANHYTPRKVIQPWTEPGECWAYHGSHGKIEIELAYPTIIEHVTLEHIPASASLTGIIDDAPKTFNVLGKLNDEYIVIDSFTYDTEGPPVQTFEIKKSTKTAHKRIMLEILSNWGHSEYTCIYRFKVHGKMDV